MKSDKKKLDPKSWNCSPIKYQVWIFKQCSVSNFFQLWLRGGGGGDGHGRLKEQRWEKCTNWWKGNKSTATKHPQALPPSPPPTEQTWRKTHPISAPVKAPLQENGVRGHGMGWGCVNIQSFPGIKSHTYATKNEREKKAKSNLCPKKGKKKPSCCRNAHLHWQTTQPISPQSHNTTIM